MARKKVKSALAVRSVMERQIVRAERVARQRAREQAEHWDLCPMLTNAEKARDLYSAYMIGYHHGAVDALGRSESYE